MSTKTEPDPLTASSEVEYATLGFYEPGCFHLRVNTDDDLTALSKLAEASGTASWAPTFLHEYIHFLQDITTTHGLLNFIFYNEHLKNANKQVAEGTHTEFVIPLPISNNFNLHTNKRLLDIYRGGENQHLVESIRDLSYEKKEVSVACANGKTINVPKYIVSYYDEQAQTSMECHFGSIHIKEYMTHAVQKQFEPKTTHSDIPYRLVELIIAAEFPRLAEDASLMITLCDASLMDYHPANLFFHALERMKANPLLAPADVDSVYSFAYQGVKFESLQNQRKTIDSLFNETADMAVGHFRDSLKGDLFKDNVRWFEELMIQARKLRSKHRGFFTQLVTSPRQLSDPFIEITKALGIPYTTNAQSKGYFFPPEKLNALAIIPYFPKVFQAIRGTFGGSNKCSMYDFCNAEQEDNMTNTNCLDQPWERINLPQLCPYAQIWKTWGLSEKKPIHSQRK